MAYSFSKLQIPILSFNFLAFIAILALALLFTYSITIVIASLAFIAVKSFGLFNIFFSIMDIARYPSTIYSYEMRFFISFLFPVAIASSFPALALIKGYALIDLLWMVLPVFGFLIFAWVMWKIAMKRYTSAGG